MKKLKQERIFGYGTYGEFLGDYFKKELIAVEDMNRIRQIKDSRKKYEKRFQPMGYNEQF